MPIKQRYTISKLEEKIIQLEARGGKAEGIMLVIPSKIEKDKPFTMGISLLDKDRLPSFNNNLVLTIIEESSKSNIVSVRFSPSEISTIKVEGMTCKNIGFTRFYATLDSINYYSNPAYVEESVSERMLWGDPHIHTTIGDCHPKRCRTRNLAYTAARHVYHLDWVAVTDHVSWNPRGTLGKWLDNVVSTDLYQEDGKFTALYSYETSMRGGDGGDNNVYFEEPPTMYIDPWEDEMNTKDLCEKLNSNKEDFFIVPHHTTRNDKHGEISKDIYPGKKEMPVVEIHSKWGTSEFRGNINPLHKVHTGPSYAQDLLNKGYYLGFIGGTDSHTSLTFNRTMESPIHDRMPGLTCVKSLNNNRKSIFDSIKNRACYAASDDRLFLDVIVNDTIEMGQEIDVVKTAPAPIISVKCATITDIEKVDIVRNGKDIYTVKPEGWNTSFDWKDEYDWQKSPIKSQVTGIDFIYYYIRVTSKNGAQAWSSPIWFNIKK